MGRDAAGLLWNAWTTGEKLDELPIQFQPRNRAEAYAVQAQVLACSGQRQVGWKIAATSLAGQNHIGVSGPLAARLMSGRVLTSGGSVPIAKNIMRVAEAEFAFCLGRDLPPKTQPYAADEVLEAVATFLPAIEIPDSRYRTFDRVGAEQLIADCACACWLFAGEPIRETWRAVDLGRHIVNANVNGRKLAEGSGSLVLGDPRVALTWLVNEVAKFAGGVKAGEIVTTGTCIVPVPIAAGDTVSVDFGELGRVSGLLL